MRFLLPLILLFLGCFPVASSPFVYPLKPTTELAEDCEPLVLILDNTEQDKFLGFQFVLGIIPLTRLYSLEPVGVLVEKELASTLRQSGFCVLNTSRKFAKQVQKASRARVVIELSAVESSAVAFDLLLIRRLSVSGSFLMRIYHSLDEAPVEQIISISKGEFSRKGFSVQLVTLLRDAIQEEIEEQVMPLVRHRKLRKKKCTLPFQGLYLAPPKLSNQVVEMYPKLEGRFATHLLSAGWHDEIQTRFTKGLASAVNGEPYVWGYEYVPGKLCLRWRVHTDILELKQVEQHLVLDARIRLYDGARLVEQASCRINRKLNAREEDVPLLVLSDLTKSVLDDFYYRVNKQGAANTTGLNSTAQPRVVCEARSR